LCVSCFNEKKMFFGFLVPPTPVDVVLTRNATDDTHTLDVAWVIQSNLYVLSSFKIVLISSSDETTTYNYSDVLSGTNFFTSIGGLIPGEKYTAHVKSQSGIVHSPDSVASSPARLSK